jgi:phosphoribosyl-ATP pyrophosphohydrolase
MFEHTQSPADTVPFATLKDYETWVASDWMYPLGSDKAQRHVRAKQREEVRELNEALANGSPEDIISEMGDVLWTSEAVALNEGFTLEEAFRLSSIADQLPEGELTTSDVDALARTVEIEWDAPVLRALYGASTEEVSDRVKDGNMEMTRLVLNGLSHQLGRSAHMARVLTPENPMLWLDEVRAAEALTQTVILVSLIAQTHLGSSLADVMEANREKLAMRLAQGKPVTKTPRK